MMEESVYKESVSRVSKAANTVVADWHDEVRGHETLREVSHAREKRK